MNKKGTMKELIECLDLIETMHARTFKLLLECRTPPEDAENADLVDMAFLMRKAALLAEDLRKELRGAKEFLERLICLRWLADAEGLNDIHVDMSIRGKLATGTPRIKTTASLPLQEKDPEAYRTFMKRIGVFGQAIKRGLVRPHWPSLTDYFSDLIAQGKPLPPGIDPKKTYSTYQVVMREKKPNE